MVKLMAGGNETMSQNKDQDQDQEEGDFKPVCCIKDCVRDADTFDGKSETWYCQYHYLIKVILLSENLKFYAPGQGPSEFKELS